MGSEMCIRDSPWGDLRADTQFLGTGDFDNDGWLDVMLRDQQTGDFLLEAGSSDGFETKLWGNWTTNAEWNNFQIADFDNDGLLDVLATEPSGNWWLAKNNGTRFLNHHWGRFQDFNWQTIVTGDFNGDAIEDVAALGQDNTWWVWEGTFTGFEVPRFFGHWNMSETWSDISVANLNNDGSDDLIGRDQDGALWVGSSTGDRFQTWSWGTGWIASAEWTNVEHFDVDRDGLVDQVGQAKDGTLWIAQNMGGRFQNHFWMRVTGSPGFVDYVSSFEQQDRLSLTQLFPGASDVFQPREPTIETETGLREMDDRVRVSVNEDGFFVVEGDGVQVAGLDFQSPSGSLIPSMEGVANGASDPEAEPFQIFLTNTANQITIGNLGSEVTIDDPIVLSFGYELNDARDLTVDFGVEGSSVPASVDEELFDPETEITTFRVLALSPREIAADNVAAYDLVAANGFSSAVDSTSGADPLPEPEANVEPEPSVVPQSVPLTGVLRDGKIVLISSEPVEAIGLDFQSAIGLIEPVPDEIGAAPFTFLLSNTANQIVWGNLGSTVRIDGELATEAGYLGDPTSGDLRLFVGIDGRAVEFQLTNES